MQINKDALECGAFESLLSFLLSPINQSPLLSAYICTRYVNALVELGECIPEPANNAEWLLSPAPLILKDVLVLLPLGSPKHTGLLFSVNLTATVFLSVPITPVVNNKILLAVAAGVIVLLIQY